MTAAPKPKKLKLSPTRIKAFLFCPMYYRLEYIEKVGRFYHTSRPGFSFGSTLHNSLQQFHESGGTKEVTVEELVQTMEASWQSAGFKTVEQEERFKEAGKALLHIYHADAALRQDTTRVFLTEKMLQWDMGPFILTGRIDRIDEHLPTGDLEIVDYKSGMTEITEDDVRKMLSMCIYQLLTKRNNPTRRVYATIHALMGGVTASAELSDPELDELEDMLRGTGLEILETDYDAVKPIQIPESCPTCDFLPVCQRYWKNQPQEN